MNEIQPRAKTMKTIPYSLVCALLLPTVSAHAGGEPPKDDLQTPSQKAAESRQRHEAPSVLTRLREVVGLEVRTLQEQKLGTVDDVILDLRAGRVVAVVVASGGVLGVGATQRTVPPAAFHYDEGKNVLHVDITKESFELNPTFDPSRWAEYRHQPAGLSGPIGTQGDARFPPRIRSTPTTQR